MIRLYCPHLSLVWWGLGRQGSSCKLSFEVKYKSFVYTGYLYFAHTLLCWTGEMFIVHEVRGFPRNYPLLSYTGISDLGWPASPLKWPQSCLCEANPSTKNQQKPLENHHFEQISMFGRSCWLLAALLATRWPPRSAT